MSYGKGVSSGCTTGFSIICTTIKLPLDELLEVEEVKEQIAKAYAQAHAQDMEEDGNEDINMWYDDYPAIKVLKRIEHEGHIL
ncbi:hypothetical protein AZE42_11940 [Rhizopogon vesiculosus]|uniref:Uncharacterized protein n=1 Tax=Rhizopogon vesiculosus TaxID=180088 RepID=A0A1J8PI77_9AGAM|nr:hypothetical protein AZE42_11940 [Rhizopogon vesiculosus]